MKPADKTTPLLHSVATTKRLLGDLGNTSIFALINRGDLERVKILNRT